MAFSVTIPETTVYSIDELDKMWSTYRDQFLKENIRLRKEREAKRRDLATYGLMQGSLVTIGKGTKVWSVVRISSYFPDGYARDGVYLRDAGTGPLNDRTTHIPLDEISRLKKVE